MTSDGGDMVARVVQAVIERAEQACRYAAKHNDGNIEAGPYRDGFEVACEVCESVIAEHVRRHIAADLAALSHPMTSRDGERR